MMLNKSGEAAIFMSSVVHEYAKYVVQCDYLYGMMATEVVIDSACTV